jgi:cytidine deaminase
MESERDFCSITDAEIKRLFELAWEVRDNAHVIGPTKVGCAVLAGDGRVFSGCNVEHRFRSHDVHAEVNAITSMVSGGSTSLRAVAIAAERERFTPCGACMDWIMQFVDGDCGVFAQSKPGGKIQKFTARGLMPFYPL